MVRIALGQLNTTVGDLDGNVSRMAEWAARAAEGGADLVCFPELAVTGYPPEDLVLRRSFVDDNLAAVSRLAKQVEGGPTVVTGFVDRTGRGLHNAAAVLQGGEVRSRYHKIKLPNYGVFDERRYFVAGTSATIDEAAGAAFGMSVCEDAWTPGDPFVEYRSAHVPIVINVNGSPYHRGKVEERTDICAARAQETDAWLVYVNAVGGQDELVFDGGSMVVSPRGEVVRRASMFTEDLLLVDLEVGENLERPVLADRASTAWPEDIEQVYRALVLGLGDYARKNGFHDTVLGLSGGIDSSLVAVLAVDALGPDAVRGLAMPSPYSSSHSVEDAVALAQRLGIRLDTIRIDETLGAYGSALAPVLDGQPVGLVEENLQARIRGNLLFAVSNRFGDLVLATGNKSEYAVGYSTLYGDMAGGFAPIKDVPKTLVYQLSRWRNTQAAARGEVAPIPDRVLDKPPSAELRPGQKDTDSLPPYDVLDPIIEAYVEDDTSPEDLVAHGATPELIERVVAMIDRAEYKRRQAAPGVKITPKAFGRDRRLPITNRYS
ncbi:MAG: NAD+ synthase [Actinomycetota bacterium]